LGNLATNNAQPPSKLSQKILRYSLISNQKKSEVFPVPHGFQCFSSGIPVESSRIPVESSGIPVESSGIPVESSGLPLEVHWTFEQSQT